MAKEKEDRLKKVLEDMSYSLNHIEDIMADDRALLVKLVKQNNTIVEFLKQIEIDDVKRFDFNDKTYCIYRLNDGFYATDGLCTHEEVHLDLQFRCRPYHYLKFAFFQ